MPHRCPVVVQGDLVVGRWSDEEAVEASRPEGATERCTLAPSIEVVPDESRRICYDQFELRFGKPAQRRSRQGHTKRPC